MMTTKLAPLTIYEWMLLNGDRLADAIKEDGKMDGPKSHPILNEAQGIDRPGQSFNQARKLLREKLRERGLRGLLPED
jgi:hypothetical protein